MFPELWRVIAYDDGYLLALGEYVREEPVSPVVDAIRAVWLRTHIYRRKVEVRIVQQPAVVRGDLCRIPWFGVVVPDCDRADVDLHAHRAYRTPRLRQSSGMTPEVVWHRLCRFRSRLPDRSRHFVSQRSERFPQSLDLRSFARSRVREDHTVDVQD
jgi:hypothetical protein